MRVRRTAAIAAAQRDEAYLVAADLNATEHYLPAAVGGAAGGFGRRIALSASTDRSEQALLLRKGNATESPRRTEEIDQVSVVIVGRQQIYYGVRRPDLEDE
jgi:hypothetical protein